MTRGGGNLPSHLDAYSRFAFGYSHVVVWRAVLALQLRDWLRARGGQRG